VNGLSQINRIAAIVNAVPRIVAAVHITLLLPREVKNSQNPPRETVMGNC